MIPNVKLSSFDGELLEDPSIYMCLVGRLLYLTISQLDIMFVVHKLNQYISQLRKPHLEATYHLLQYLKGAPSKL